MLRLDVNQLSNESLLMDDFEGADSPNSNQAERGLSLRDEFAIDPEVTYLNHGSFGPSPKIVQRAREKYSRELEANPMEFFVRKMGGYLDRVRAELGGFLQGKRENFAFVPNATAGMNVIARNVELSPGDEVLLNDHEYGSVVRIWNQRCQETGACVVTAHLPTPVTTKEEIVSQLMASVTDKTKLIVISHVTSVTALIMPVAEIVRAARERNILVAVDGPHAPAMVDVNLNQIDPDYYTASCHKWLSAPFGTGFLYARSRFKQGMKPLITSWGRSLTGKEPEWVDEFHWPGTYDPAGYLAIGDAIRFLKEVGLRRFREHGHALAKTGRDRILALRRTEPLSPDSDEWYGTMATIPLGVPYGENRANDSHPLQKWLYETKHIEIPVINWKGQTHIRVSGHLYNDVNDINKLVNAVEEWFQDN